MSGIAGLIFLGVAFVFRLTEVAQARYWIGAAAVCYVIASFQAWKRERHTITTLKVEIERLTQSVEGLAQAEGATSLTPEQLVGIFKGRTSLQGEKLASTYTDKWMILSGTVHDISQRHEGIGIVFHVTQPWITIMMHFGKEFIEPISALSKGDKVTVRGQIRKIEATLVSLENCQLVKF